MRDILIVLSGFIAGIVAWFPCGIGLAAHRYNLGGAKIKSTNRWVLLAMRTFGSFSVVGRIIYVLIMLVWLCVFFGSMLVPMLVAKILGMPEASESVGYAIYANFFVAAVAFIAGPALWRKVAL